MPSPPVSFQQVAQEKRRGRRLLALAWLLVAAFSLFCLTLFL